MIEFNKLTFDKLEEIRKYLAQSKNRGCSFCVGNNYIWNVEDRLAYAIINEHLVYRMVFENEAVYRIPELNDQFVATIKALMEDAKEIGKAFKLADLSEEMTKCLEEGFPEQFDIQYARDSSDYVYEVEKLIKLSGKKYHGKKNHINRFNKNYTYTYEAITEENMAECLEMEDEWLASKTEHLDELKVERKVVQRAFDHFYQLGFKGGLIRVEGKVMAFTLGEEVTEDTFVTHIEKALDAIPELYPMINQQFAEHALSSYQYVNREEDLGIEGLRKAKLSYHPVFLIDKYTAVPKKA